MSNDNSAKRPNHSHVLSVTIFHHRLRAGSEEAGIGVNQRTSSPTMQISSGQSRYEASTVYEPTRTPKKTNPNLRKS